MEMAFQTGSPGRCTAKTYAMRQSDPGAYHDLLPILLSNVGSRHNCLPRLFGELILADALAVTAGGAHC